MDHTCTCEDIFCNCGLPDSVRPEDAPATIGPLCGRCYDNGVELFPANCEEKPEGRGNLGMYHCPDCGAMVLGGLTHPPLCRVCLERKHPEFDNIPA